MQLHRHRLMFKQFMRCVSVDFACNFRGDEKVQQTNTCGEYCTTNRPTHQRLVFCSLVRNASKQKARKHCHRISFHTRCCLWFREAELVKNCSPYVCVRAFFLLTIQPFLSACDYIGFAYFHILFHSHIRFHSVRYNQSPH